MKFKGICPITGKEETVYCENINCTTLDGVQNYILGTMYDCSAKGRYNLCNNCPINPNNYKGDN